MNQAPAARRFYRQSIEIPYGIVFGFNHKDEDEREIKQSCYKELITPINNKLHPNKNTNLTEAKVSALMTLIETLNKIDNKIITYHNGYQDGGCAFNGHHWHIVADCRIHPTIDSRWGKEISRIGQATKEVYIKAQVANSSVALARHIVKPPRHLIYSGGKYSDIAADPVLELSSGSTPMQPDWSNAKLTEGANYARVTNLIKLMKKYRTPDQGILKHRILSQSMEDWDILIQVICLPSFEILFKKAQELYKTEDKTMSFEARFSSKWTPYDGETDIYLSKEASHDLLKKWFIHQNIEGEQFIAHLRNVLGRRVPKVNTFCLVGEASSGKSYIIRSLLPYYTYWGESHGENNNVTFMWQGLIDCSIGIMEECLITQAMADHAKLILEGAQTMVKVKCKQDQVLAPLPILITSNQDPWMNCSSHKQALMDRMYYYRTRSMPELKAIKKALHPNIWYDLFKVHPEVTEELDDEELMAYAEASEELERKKTPIGEEKKKLCVKSIQALDMTLEDARKYVKDNPHMSKSIKYKTCQEIISKSLNESFNTKKPWLKRPSIHEEIEGREEALIESLTSSQDLFTSQKSIYLDPTQSAQKEISKEEYEMIIRTQKYNDTICEVIEDTPPKKKNKLSLKKK